MPLFQKHHRSFFIVVLIMSTLSFGVSMQSISIAQIDPTPTPLLDFAKIVTITGQLLPAVNTGSNAGMGGLENEYREPIEYHLVDTNGHSIRLTFENTVFYGQFYEKWVKPNSAQAESILGQLTATPQFE